MLEDILNARSNGIAVQADVSKEDDVERLFATVDRDLGGLKLLVNNAGVVSAQRRVEAMDAVRIERVLSVNVVGAFLCAREAIKRMSSKRNGTGGEITPK